MDVCNGCGCRPEYYMVSASVWKSVRRDGDRFLCLSCVENRLDRNLAQSDFPDLPVNELLHFAYRRYTTNG